jgi:hypothetical protein
MMKMASPAHCLQSIRHLTVVVGALITAALGYAQPRQDPGVVEYISSITQIQAQIPFSYSYQLTVKSPSTLVTGVSVPVTFSTTVVSKPAAITDSLAKSYVSFSPAQITFTAPGQSQTVTVTFAVPQGGVAGAYGYQLFAVGWPVDPVVGLNNFGTSINATVTFAPTPVPPAVTIATPADGSTITVSSFPAQVQLQFSAAASSLYPITSVSASYAPNGQSGGTGVALTTSNINTATATATGTMTIPAAGRYVVTALGTNSVTTANDVNTFDVVLASTTPPTTGSLTGKVFFDVDGDGNFDADEIGLAGATVTLLTATGTAVPGVSPRATDASGSYSFSGLASGTTYTIRASNGLGMTLSTANNVPATIAAPAPSIGFKLDFASIRSMRADGNSQGFWKTNLQKGGKQVSDCAIDAYTRLIASPLFLLDGANCFQGLTESSAIDILSSNSSNAVSLLRKQLLAAEYNFTNGAFFNDSASNMVVTYLFLYYGEYIVKNSSRFSTADILLAKDRFEAYNTSHGGVIGGP